MSTTLESKPTPIARQHSDGRRSRKAADGDGLRPVLAAFASVAAAAQESTQLDDLLHVVARQICELVGVKRCSIHLRDEREGLFRGCVCYVGAPTRAGDIKRSRAGGPADRMTQELLATGAPVIIDNAPEDPRVIKSTVRYWGIRSIMAVPMIIRGEVLGVVFLDDVDRPHAFSAQDAEIASTFGNLAAVVVMHAQQEAELRGQVDAGARHIRALRRATAVDDRLSSLVLDGRSLQDLLDNLAELLSKPCAVFSEDGERLACAASPGSEDGMVPRLLEPDCAAHPEVRDALAAHGDSRAFVVGPFPQARILHRHVVAPIIVGGRAWGNLVVMEHKTRFVGGDMLTLRRAATLVALQINATRQAIEADGGAGASLVSDLMSTGADLGEVRRRADRLGIGLDEQRVVMLIAPRDARGSGGLDYRPFAAALERLAPHRVAHLSTVGAGVAILARMPAGADEQEFVAEAKALAGAVCAHVDPDGSLIAAISDVRCSPEGYRAAYAEVAQTVDCIRRFSPLGGPPVFAVSDLGAGRLFLATSDEDLIMDFAESTIGTLVNDPAMADLLTTLCSFFDNMASIRRCAACLGVHENTIRYRLARIEDLTGLAVTHDPDAQLRVRLSLLVLLLQGRLPGTDRLGISQQSLPA